MYLNIPLNSTGFFSSPWVTIYNKIKEPRGFVGILTNPQGHVPSNLRACVRYLTSVENRNQQDRNYGDMRGFESENCQKITYKYVVSKCCTSKIRNFQSSNWKNKKRTTDIICLWKTSFISTPLLVSSLNTVPFWKTLAIPKTSSSIQEATASLSPWKSARRKSS